MPLIQEISQLHEYLQKAIQLEHSTIPAYSCALYTIIPGKNLDSSQIIRTVLVEEMLHIVLVANVLNAVGGKPNLTQKGFVPDYPTYLPDGETDFMVHLRRFSPQAIQTFLKIERPALAPKKEQRLLKKTREKNFFADLSNLKEDMHFYSIGEFYEAIIEGLRYLYQKYGDALFCGDASHQITPEYYYSGGGNIIPVMGIDSAIAALTLIIEQGEGSGGEIYDSKYEISHYYRFQQILKGRYYRCGDQPGEPTGAPMCIDWEAVYPMKTDPKLDEYPPDSEVRQAAERFNTRYGRFLSEIETALSGEPQLLQPAVGEMFRLKEWVNQLVRNPIAGKRIFHAGPTFEVNP